MPYRSKDSGLFSIDEFNRRGVIKLAPDVLVYIGGSQTMQILSPVAQASSGTGTSFDFSDGITSVSVQNNLEPPGSSNCSIEVITPVYDERSRYWVPFITPDNVLIRAPIFVPMMEVKVFFKGRFMVGDPPEVKYYPAFWGFITNVEESYSGGVHKISLQCGDILHWWSYATITTHPSVADGSYGQPLTIYSTIFNESNPFTIIYRLFTEFGMADFVAPTWLAQFQPPGGNFPVKLFQKAATGIMSYWRSRFGNLGSLLKMYGIEGREVLVHKEVNGRYITTTGPKVWARYPEMEVPAKVKKSKAQKTLTDFTYQKYNIEKIGEWLRNFTVFFEFDKLASQFETSEFMTKLEIATEVKNRCEYEFYQDVTGSFIFKPPFYNMNVRGIQPYEIYPHDIINFSFGVDSDAIVTVMQVKVPFHPQLRHTAFARGMGYHMDMELVKRFGVRYREKEIGNIFSSSLARSLAVAELGVTNAHAYSGSVTVPGRPELRLGYPIYIAHRDSFHYIKSLNHTFDYGGTFSTTISLIAERRKVFKFQKSSGGSDEDGQYMNEVLYNGVYKFTGRLLPPVSENPDEPPEITDTTIDDQIAKQFTNASNLIVGGSHEGLYEIVSLEGKEYHTITEFTIPYTDEFGYQVIGAFPYGRGMDPAQITGDSTAIPKNSQTLTITNMKAAIGSLDEAQKMPDLLFMAYNAQNKDKMREGIVPPYLDNENIQYGTTELTEKPSEQEIRIVSPDETKTQSSGPKVSSKKKKPSPTGISPNNQGSQTTGQTTSGPFVRLVA